MDGSAWASEAEHDQNAGEQSGLSSATIGVAHLVGIFVLFSICRYCCCGKRPAQTAAEVAQGNMLHVELEHLQPKKRLLTGYLLWLLCGPAANAHLFYLGRVAHGLVAAWTLNFSVAGWLLDAVFMPYYVRRCNAAYAAPAVFYDGSRRQLLCRLPLLLLTGIGMLLAVVVYAPWALHHAGVVDVDRIAAQTEANPYEVLGLSRYAGLAEAKAAYRKESLRWHPDRNVGCGKECEEKMSEITKAFNLIKKRRAPPPPDRTWESWLQDLGSDCKVMLEVLSQERGPAAEAKSDL